MTEYYLISKDDFEKIKNPFIALISMQILKHNGFEAGKRAVLANAQKVDVQAAFDTYIQLGMLLGDEFTERAKSLGKDYQDFESFLKEKMNGI